MKAISTLLLQKTHGAVGGVDGVECVAVAGVDEFVVNEELVGEADVHVVHVLLNLRKTRKEGYIM